MHRFDFFACEINSMAGLPVGRAVLFHVSSKPTQPVHRLIADLTMKPLLYGRFRATHAHHLPRSGVRARPSPGVLPCAAPTPDLDPQVPACRRLREPA